MKALTLTRKVYTRIKHTGTASTIGYLLGTCLLRSLGIEVIRSYAWSEPNSEHSIPDTPLNFFIATSLKDFTLADLSSLRNYGKEVPDVFSNLFDSGARCVMLRQAEDGILSACWLLTRQHFAAGPQYPCVVIERCFVMPQCRGRGLYPQTLRLACQYLVQEGVAPRQIIIESSIFNSSSTRGIVKAGFTPIAIMYRVGKIRWRRMIAS